MNIYVCFIFFVTGGFWVLTLGAQKILSKKEAAVLFRKLTKYENFGTFQWCLGKCIYIYIHVWEYACYQICTYMLGQNYIYIIYICMHVTACIFG